MRGHTRLERAFGVLITFFIATSDRASATDCDNNGLADADEITEDPSLDCDHDGVLDSCQNDCNRNGVPDPCEIASGAVEDANGNGVPDSCEDEPTFFAEFTTLGSPTVDRRGNMWIAQDVGVLLHTLGLEDGEPCAQGWVLSIGVGEGCALTEITTEGTVAANVTDDPPGLVDAGFHVANFWHDPRGLPGGATFTTVLSFQFDITLAPEGSPHLIARMVVGADPSGSGPCFECQVRLEESDFAYPSRVSNIVMRNGNSYEMRSEPFQIEVCAELFHRGDATADGLLDISDGVVIVAHLFLGLPQPVCLEAADANDDGSVDISDTVYILGFLFTGGPALPHPGPPGEPCGVDRAESPARLSCESYPPCPR